MFIYLLSYYCYYYCYYYLSNNLIVSCSCIGKDFHSARICVFRLTDFEDGDEEVKTKEDCKNCKIEKTKGSFKYSAQADSTLYQMQVDFS